MWLLLATLLRRAAGGSSPASSVPAAVLFVVALVPAAWLYRDLIPLRGGTRTVAAGIIGGLVAVVAAAAGRVVIVQLGAAPGTLAWWVPLVVAVAVSEELLLRGAIFTAAVRDGGEATALVLTSVLFGVIHVPLYGWVAVPLDIAVGLGLGGLRLLTRSTVAPAVAHALADVAAAVVTT